jgi:hypothetical protein
MDDRVKAIRADEKVGRGTCAMIDECYTDEELIRELDEDGATTPDAAVKWARWAEGLWREQEQNCAWDGPSE